MSWTGKSTYEELNKSEKRAITEQFLTTPCVRCNDKNHSCLNCPDESPSDYTSTAYGKLRPGKKLGAKKHIRDLKEKYNKNKEDPLFKKTDEQQSLSVASNLTASSHHSLGDESEPVFGYQYRHEREEVARRGPPKPHELRRAPTSPDRNIPTNKDLHRRQEYELDYPARTNFSGGKVKILTNHFQLMCNSDGPITLYEFTVPELEGKGKRKARAIIESIIANCAVLTQHQASFATDHCCTIVAWVDLRTLLSAADYTLISSPGSAAQYRLLTSSDGPLSLQFKREVNMQDLFRYAQMDPGLAPDINIEPMTNIFNIIISKCVEQSTVGTVPGGANKYYRKDAHESFIKCVSLCMHRGYSYTVKAGVSAVLLNVNSLTSAFWCPVTVDRVLKDSTFGMEGETLSGVINGLHVYITYDRGDKKADPEAEKKLNSREGRIKQIVGLGSAATQQRFTLEDGTSTTVANYFATNYGTNFLKFGNLPVVNLGKKNDPRWYPAEKLEILAYQKYKGLPPKLLITEMLKNACRIPSEAKALVGVEGLETLGVPRDHNRNFALPSCRLFSLHPSLLQVNALKLDLPEIQYGKGGSLRSISGQWNFSAMKFYKQAINKQFAALVVRQFEVNSGTAGQILNHLQTWTKTKFGVATVNSDPRTQVVLNRTNDFQPMQDWLAKNGTRTEMALLLLNRKDTTAYSIFKDLCDRKYGLHSICLSQPLNCKKGNDGGRWSKIALKMNLKAAGINHTIKNGLIQEFMKDTLVLGADVTHPGPGSIPGCPSIAAIVGSVDEHAGRFLGSMRLQRKSRKEIIDEVEDMARERVRDWIMEMTPGSQRYVTLPKKILYYRDGVSEGMYKQVKDYELPALVKAFIAVRDELCSEGRVDPNAPSYTPKMIAVVCGKRHHVRFYPVNESRAETTNNNCHPGTAVDDLVTSPYYQDFYLQSHVAIKGTARPAHYFVIENQPKEPLDRIRTFTHEICYTYVRAPVGVSYAAPAYYADRLCERGRCYFRDFFVAPRNRPFRDDYDKFRNEAEQEFQRFRKKDFPKGHPPRGKDKALAVREAQDKENLQKRCDDYIMAKAKEEFRRYTKVGNPWSPKISKTMFWM